MNSAKRIESESQDDATSRESRRHAPARSHAHEDTRTSSRPSAQVRVAERDSLYDDVPCTD
jgi:hypothetical protein